MSHRKFLSLCPVVWVPLTLASALDCPADSAYFLDLDLSSASYGDTVATGLCACLDFDSAIRGTDSTITLTILLMENEPLRGFQFEIGDNSDDALVLKSVSTGSKIDGWTVRAVETPDGSALVLGFSPSGEETVPDSEGVLVFVTFEIVGKLGDSIAFHFEGKGGVLSSDRDAENVACAYPDINDPVVFPINWLATETSATKSPGEFALLPNFPNPFNPGTVIRFYLAEKGDVEVSIYNILGQKVLSLADARMLAGYHEIWWDGHDRKGVKVASGVYIYTLSAGEYFEQKKMVLLR